MVVAGSVTTTHRLYPTPVWYNRPQHTPPAAKSQGRLAFQTVISTFDPWSVPNPRQWLQPGAADSPLLTTREIFMSPATLPGDLRCVRNST